MAEEQRPEVLGLLQNDATARFRQAGSPLLEFAQEVEKAGSPQFIVTITGRRASRVAADVKPVKRAKA